MNNSFVTRTIVTRSVGIAIVTSPRRRRTNPAPTFSSALVLEDMSDKLRLCHSLPVPLKREIIHRLWRRPIDEVDLEDYETYFKHYEATCRQLYLGVRSREIDVIAVNSNEHLLLNIDCLWSCIDSGNSVTRPAMRDSLSKTYFSGQSYERLDASIDLALQLWLTMKIKGGHLTSEQKRPPWEDATYLKEFVGNYFHAPKVERKESIFLGSDLHAVNLQRINGIQMK